MIVLPVTVILLWNLLIHFLFSDFVWLAVSPLEPWIVLFVILMLLHVWP